MLSLILLKSLALPTQAELYQKLTSLLSSAEGQVGVTFINLKTNQQIQISGDKLFPAASVAKLGVLTAAFHLSDLKQLDLNQRILFKESDKLEGAGVLRWMKGGQLYTLWNLLRLMITLSDNTATKLAIETIGLDKINNYLSQAGLKHTIIKDPTMLVEPPNPNNNLSTPNDIARLLALIYYRQGFTEKSAKQMISWMHYQRYRWGIWRGVPPGTYVANKTGHLEGIVNDAGIIYTKKGAYILAIFTWGFKKKSVARKLINEISKITYEEYTGEKVVSPPKKVIKRQLLRRPSGKFPRRWGRREKVLNRKSQTYPRR